MSASALLGVRVGDRVGGGIDESVGGSVMASPRNAEVPVAPELIADLYEPHLIITADYVGPDPRFLEWGRPRREGAGGAPLGQAFSGRMLETVIVVLITVAVVVPITLIASQAVRGAPSPRPTIRIISAPPSSAPHASPAGRSANPISPDSSGATPVAPGAVTGSSARGANDRRAERAQIAADRRAERIARQAARARWHGSPAVAPLAGH